MVRSPMAVNSAIRTTLYYEVFPNRRPDYFRMPWTYPAAVWVWTRGHNTAGRLGLFLPSDDRLALTNPALQQLAKALAASGTNVCI
jgi:hypothetical protein